MSGVDTSTKMKNLSGEPLRKVKDDRQKFRYRLALQNEAVHIPHDGRRGTRVENHRHARLHFLAFSGKLRARRSTEHVIGNNDGHWVVAQQVQRLFRGSGAENRKTLFLKNPASQPKLAFAVVYAEN
jgi:hypothetical protein